MFDDFVQSSSSSQPSSSRNPNPYFAGATAGGHVGPSSAGRLGRADASDRAVSSSARVGPQHPQGLDLVDDGYEHDSANASGSGYLATNSLLDPVAALETGFISSDLDPSTSSTPIFQLGRVQYAFSAPLALMTVSSNILTMCLFAYPTSGANGNPFPSAPPKLIRINLDDPERTEEADVPIPPVPRASRNQPPQDPTTIGPHKMFSDPSGKHLLLTMRNGDCYYWTSGWKKARILNKMKGMVVESVAWNKFSDAVSAVAASANNRRRGGGGSAALSSTREILVGTRTGDIYEIVITATAGSDADEGDFFDKIARRTAGSGGDRGDIDKLVRHIYTLPERQPVTGLTAEPFPRSTQANPNGSTAGNAADKAIARRINTPKAVVIATTSTRIYEFVGNLGKLKGDESESESLYERLFEPYRGDAVPNLKSELPGDLPYSELHTWTNSGRRESSALAWLTGPGVYHGLLSYSDQNIGDSVIDSANLLPYPAIALDGGGGGFGAAGGGGGGGSGAAGGGSRRNSAMVGGVGGGSNAHTIAEIPLSIVLTEFHFILLYQDRVMAISSLDDQVIFEEALPLRPQERVIGTAVDVAKRTFWVYTDSSIFELVVKDEDRDVWRIYLERGSFDAALKYAKAGVQRGTVLSSQGDRFFAEARYIQAAQCYAQTFMRSFEEIVLRFVESGQRDALRYYLVMRLERLRRSDGPQRTMLATWLVEIYLSKINQLEDIAAAEAASQDVENYKLEKEMLAEELLQFLSTYQDVLNPRTTYGLIQKHGRAEVLLHYAAVIGDYDRIVRHHVQGEAWSSAIETLDRQESEDLYYHFATVLMRHAPAEVVDCWTRRRSLEPRRLIPALLQHRPDRVKREKNQAIRYLRHVTETDGNTDTAIHNLLLTLLARSAAAAASSVATLSIMDTDNGTADAAKADLLSFIDSAPSNPLTSQPYFDLDYALRTCSANGQKEACVRIYAKMGLYESAVDLAIQEREMDLACSCADLVENDRELKKKLWLKVAKEMVRSTEDVKSAMQFLSRTNLLTLEDVLPYFPDFVVIDTIKSSICDALESYATHIESLKDEMEEASRSALAIQSDIEALSSRFVTVGPEQRCEECGGEVVDRMFYVFPCRHSWHADCLVRKAARTMSGAKLRRLVEVQAGLAAITTGAVTAAPNAVGSSGTEAASRGVTALTAAATAATAASRAALNLDKLREMVAPDAIIGAISTGVSVSVAGGRRALAPLDPFSNPNSDWVAGSRSSKPRVMAGSATPDGLATKTVHTARTGGREEQEEVVQTLKDELDRLIAAECGLCGAAVADVGRGFVGRSEDEDWRL